MNRARNNTQNGWGTGGFGGMNNGRVGGVTGNGNMNGTNGRTDMNGQNNMYGRTGTNGRNPSGSMLSGSLADQIRALTFVKTELELYLDTHPRCRTALDYYRQTVDELKRLTEMHENTTGPLTAQGNVSTEQWNWVDGPWPWHRTGDYMREGEDR